MNNSKLSFKTDFWWIFVGVLIALFLMFPGAFLEGEVAVPGQFLSMFYPWSEAGIEVDPGNTLRSDIFDARLQAWSQSSVTFSHLWSPYIQGGVPSSASLLSGHASPLVAPYLLVTSIEMAHHLSSLTRVAVGFIGMYLFLRVLRCAPVIALVGGLSYALGGFNSVWLSWSHVAVTAFGPWMLLSVEVLRKRWFGGTLLLASSTYGVVSGGFPAVAAYFLYLTAIYMGFWLLLPLLLKRQFRTLVITTVLCGVGVALGFGLAGVFMLTTNEFTNFIDVSYREPLGNLAHTHMAQLIRPFYNGNQAFTGWWTQSNYNETTGYMGILMVVGFVLSPLALIKPQHRARIVFFGIMAMVFFAVIFDIGPLLELVVELPILGSGKNTRMLVVLGLSQVVVASLTFQTLILDRWQALTRPAWERWMLLGAAVLLSILFLVLAVQFRSDAGFFEARKIAGRLLDGVKNLGMTEEWLRPASTLLAVGLVLGGVWGLVIGVFTRRYWVFAGLFVLVVMVDMGIFNFRQNPTVPAEAVFPVTPAIAFLQANADEPYERVLAVERTFFHPGTYVNYGIPSTVSHAFVNPNRRAYMQAYLGPFRTPTAILPELDSVDLTSPLFNLAGTTYLTLLPGMDLYGQQIAQERNNQPVLLPVDGSPVEQTIALPSGEIEEVCVLAATYQQVIAAEQGAFTITLIHEGEVLDRAEHDLAVLTDNNWFCSGIESDANGGGEYTLRFARSGLEDASIALWANRDNPYAEGETSGQGVPENTDLTFRVTYRAAEQGEGGEQFERVYDGADLVIYRNHEAVYAYVTNQIRTTPSIEDTISLLESEAEIAVINTPAEDADAESAALAELCYSELLPTKFENDEITYTLDGRCDGVLATSESFYPGWEVEVDGEAREVLRVNGIFRGVVVTADDSTVVFRYRPQTFMIGSVISSVSLLAYGLLAAVVFFQPGLEARLRREQVTLTPD
ncbi:MAG: hypothetical protein OHK0046_30390 [Anaerolineae bacterium]